MTLNDVVQVVFSNVRFTVFKIFVKTHCCIIACDRLLHHALPMADFCIDLQ